MARPVDAARRKEEFSLYLLDEHGNNHRALHPTGDVTISCTSSGRVGRTIASLTLPPDEAELVTRTSRIKPWTRDRKSVV